MTDAFIPIGILAVAFATGFACCMALVRNSVMALERRIRHLEAETLPHPVSKMPGLRPRYISVDKQRAY